MVAGKVGRHRELLHKRSSDILQLVLYLEVSCGASHSKKPFILHRAVRDSILCISAVASVTSVVPYLPVAKIE